MEKCEPNQKQSLDRILKIIESNKFMNIATVCGNSTPWLSNVFFDYSLSRDGSNILELTWISPINSVHSTNIQVNKQISINCYINSPVLEEIDGLYGTGTADVVRFNLKGITRLSKYALRLKKFGFLDRFKSIKEFVDERESLVGDSPLRFYTAKITNLSLLADVQYYKNRIVDKRIPVTSQSC